MTSDREPNDEVKSYVRRLLLMISIGIVLMASAATWAFLTYGKKLRTTAPLPSGTPPMATDSAAGPP
jgi:hypothetical protein